MGMAEVIRDYAGISAFFSLPFGISAVISQDPTEVFSLESYSLEDYLIIGSVVSPYLYELYTGSVRKTNWSWYLSGASIIAASTSELLNSDINTENLFGAIELDRSGLNVDTEQLIVGSNIGAYDLVDMSMWLYGVACLGNASHWTKRLKEENRLV